MLLLLVLPSFSITMQKIVVIIVYLKNDDFCMCALVFMQKTPSNEQLLLSMISNIYFIFSKNTNNNYNSENARCTIQGFFYNIKL